MEKDYLHQNLLLRDIRTRCTMRSRFYKDIEKAWNIMQKEVENALIHVSRK